MVERLAAFFRARPEQWIDARHLMPIAGTFAWRTRVSNLREAPFSMVIRNRQRRVRRPSGERFVISEYMFVPAREGARRVS
jgi:hypothetical protein